MNIVIALIIAYTLCLVGLFATPDRSVLYLIIPIGASANFLLYNFAMESYFVPAVIIITGHLIYTFKSKKVFKKLEHDIITLIFSIYVMLWVTSLIGQYYYANKLQPADIYIEEYKSIKYLFKDYERSIEYAIKNVPYFFSQSIINFKVAFPYYFSFLENGANTLQLLLGVILNGSVLISFFSILNHYIFNHSPAE